MTFPITLRRALSLAVCGVLLSGCSFKTQVPLAVKSSFASPTAAEPEPLVNGPQAIAATLAKGGYIIYLRHGRTQYDQIERERTNRENGSFSLDKCDTQRQLSDAGRDELKLAGRQFRLAGIALEKAFTSRYCRAVESATYFVDDAIPTENLSGEGEVGKNAAQKARTIAFFGTRPAPGKNLLMMAHGGIFWEATTFTVQEANAVVLDPANLKVIVARVGPHEWGAIAQAMAAR